MSGYIEALHITSYVPLLVFMYVDRFPGVPDRAVSLGGLFSFLGIAWADLKYYIARNGSVTVSSGIFEDKYPVGGALPRVKCPLHTYVERIKDR